MVMLFFFIMFVFLFFLFALTTGTLHNKQFTKKSSPKTIERIFYRRIQCKHCQNTSLDEFQKIQNRGDFQGRAQIDRAQTDEMGTRRTNFVEIWRQFS